MMANRVDAQTQVPNNPITNTRTTDRYDTQTSLATLSLINKYNNANGYLKGYYNDTLFYLRGENSNTTTSVQTNNLYGLRGRETYSIWEGSEIVNGFDLDISDLRNDQRTYSTDSTTSWEFPQHRMFSPYAAVSQMFGNKESFHVTPSAGLRLYTSNLFEDKTVPQAGLVLGYNNTNLGLNYARGVNYPSPVILQGLLTNKTSLPSGLDTKDIRPEVVDHYEMSLSHTQPGLFTASATVFHDDGRDRLRAYMYGNANPTSDFFTSSASEYKIDGLELAGSVTPTDNLELFVGATWLKTWAKGDDGETTSKMPYTPAFALQTGFKWKFFDNFQLSGDYQYLKDVYAANWMRTTNPKAPSSNVTTLNERNRLPDINVFNARLDYTFSYDDMVQIHTIFGGKNPHPNWLVGGVPCSLNLDAHGAADVINQERLELVLQLIERCRDFAQQVVLPDTLALAAFYKDWLNIGGGLSKLSVLAYGAIPDIANDYSEKSLLLPPGAIINGNFNEVLPVDLRNPDEIQESVSHSWYKPYPGGKTGLHPFDGMTEPNYAPGPNIKGTPTDLKQVDERDRYSWIKTPLWRGHQMEVGPLARLLVGYARKDTEIKGLIDEFLGQAKAPVSVLQSTLGRIAARSLELACP